MSVPEQARVVIIGGGIVGCSIAYHLAKIGWSDVVLMERKRLTSGTTWHAAGLIGQLRASANMTRLAKYTQELYVNLEAETGVQTGCRWVGSITLALTEARKEELLRQASMARAFGVNIQRVRYLNFFIGSALAAVAGVLVALLNNLVEPTMGSVPSYKALAIIVLGGLGSVRGTLIASMAIGVIESFGTIYIGHLLDRDALAFGFLILVLMFRPQGLMGAK